LVAITVRVSIDEWQPAGCNHRGPAGATGERRRERSVNEAVERIIDLPSPPDAVWAAITTPARLAAWFGASVEIEPRRGGAVRFRWRDGTERRGVVETAERPWRFAFRWRPIVRMSDGVGIGDVTRVEFRLEPASGGTRLTVTESTGIVATDATVRSAGAVDLGVAGTPRWQASG
jgi:uncharacterized protein YndB with AHSA1/START domain